MQLPLIAGFYRCHNCGRDVETVTKTRRFRLCPDCHAVIVEPMNPGKLDSLTEEEYQAREAYWRWYGQMEKRYPAPRSWARKPLAPLASLSEDLYPFCRCGQKKRPMTLLIGGQTGGLFGGPYFDKCPVCEAKASVEASFRMRQAIWPDKDVEDILDLLQKAFPEYFEAGVLPGYWFELLEGEV